MNLLNTWVILYFRGPRHISITAMTHLTLDPRPNTASDCRCPWQQLEPQLILPLSLSLQSTSEPLSLYHSILSGYYRAGLRKHVDLAHISCHGQGRHRESKPCQCVCPPETTHLSQAKSHQPSNHNTPRLPLKSTPPPPASLPSGWSIYRPLGLKMRCRLICCYFNAPYYGCWWHLRALGLRNECSWHLCCIVTITDCFRPPQNQSSSVKLNIISDFWSALSILSVYYHQKKHCLLTF